MRKSSARICKHCQVLFKKDSGFIHRDKKCILPAISENKPTSIAGRVVDLIHELKRERERIDAVITHLEASPSV